MKDNTLQEARQEWFSRELKMLNLEFPVAEIVEKTGYTNGIVSMYLSQKRAISVGFMKAFCEAYDINFEAVNHALIDEARKKILEGQSKDKEKDNIPKNTNYNSADNQNDVHTGTLKNEEKDVPLGKQNEDAMNEGSVWRTLQQLSDANRDLAESNKSLANSVAECLTMLKEKRTTVGPLKPVVT